MARSIGHKIYIATIAQRKQQVPALPSRVFSLCQNAGNYNFYEKCRKN